MRLATLFLLLLPLVAFAESSIQINGLSYHWDRDRDYNEVNTGLGFTKELKVETDFPHKVSVGFYENSHEDTSFYLLYGREVELTEDLSIGLYGGYVSGYHKRKLRYPLVVMPVITYKRFHLGITPITATLNFTIYEF